MKTRLPKVIIFRHGKRYINTGERSGDGPLMDEGIKKVTEQVLHDGLLDDLTDFKINTIDLAIVSSAVRCTETFALIWRMFTWNQVSILDVDTDKKYFSTVEEDVLWNLLYKKHGAELRQEIEEFGEKKAVMDRVGDLVDACAHRTILRIRKAIKQGAKTILVVTHAPHDTLIAHRLDGQSYPDCLELGTYRIVDVVL